MSKKDIIARLWNQSMYDYDHASANLERFYDASRADLEQRLSEADKVIKMTKFALVRIDGWLQERHMGGLVPQEKEALAAIEAYEKGQQ